MTKKTIKNIGTILIMLGGAGLIFLPKTTFLLIGFSMVVIIGFIVMNVGNKGSKPNKKEDTDGTQK